MSLNACSCLYKSHIRMLYIYENACIILFKTRRITFIKNSFIFIKRRCYSPVLAKEYFFFLSSISSSRASWTQRSNLRNAKLRFSLSARLNATLPFNARLITSAKCIPPLLTSLSDVSPSLGRKVQLERITQLWTPRSPWTLCLSSTQGRPLLTQDNFFT